MSSELRQVCAALGEGHPVCARGSSGSSAAMCCGALVSIIDAPILYLVAHLDEADEAALELESLGVEARALPALEVLPGETGVSLELLAERISLVRQIVGGRTPRVLVAPIQALMQRVPDAKAIDRSVRAIAPGDRIDMEELTRWLGDQGYSRVDSVEEAGDFAVRGGIVDIFPAGGTIRSAGAHRSESAAAPLRLDFFGDEIEHLHEIDLDTMGSDRRLDSMELVGMIPEDSGGCSISMMELLASSTVAIVHETLEVIEQGRGYYERAVDATGIDGPPEVFKLLHARLAGYLEINQFSQGDPQAQIIELPVRPLGEFSRDAGEATAELGALRESGRVVVTCQNAGEAQRMGELLAEFAPGAGVDVLEAYVHRGFIWERDQTSGRSSDQDSPIVVPMHELLHRFESRRRVRRLKAGKASETFLELEVGDLVVHADHGIAKYLGLHSMRAKAPKETKREAARRKLEGEASDRGQLEEYLTLEFASRAKLHVPVSQVDKVQKYIGGFRGRPKLSTLGGVKWSRDKEQVKESVRDLAAELLRVQAAREHMPGVRYPEDTTWQKEFEAEFPFDETEDQLAALVEIKKDMSAARPMDRLLCGDVGYGKTELAIRAAFKAAEFGRQVAVLVPTTLLAEQHDRTFTQRFAAYPFRVESISRFKSRPEQNDLLAKVRKGQVDVLIGTHRLLSKDVRFADLGLVIVDEEQRFGVEHKNALLSLRMTVDVLTMSATPIPRTLHMAMLGLRDISSLSTPPLDRRAVVTEVISFNKERIKRAIRRELNREGQIYYVHNRVHNIQSVADDVQQLAPGARIVVGHGQMPERELEGVMRRFVNREADILVSTTIIESGIDIPTANTMIINDADRFGLAELHQLRGRVGRYKHRAYCYLLLPANRNISEVAVKRLRAIEEYSMLGAGFKIAMRDLEIRGAGNLLGAEQSGHIAAVGYDMYCRLLDEAARELKQEEQATPVETTIEIGLTGALPKGYIPSEARRLEAYRRIAGAPTTDDLESVGRDLEAAYGKPPEVAKLVVELAELRVLASRLRVRSIAVQEQDVIFRCEEPDLVVEALSRAKGTVRALTRREGESVAEVYYRPPEAYLEPRSLLTVLRTRLGEPVASLTTPA